ncbi:MAG: hypothetical protein J5634_00975 [Bacilli bacterium]|nr:hypothetical protein [Bacilli bacterium]
MKEATGELNMTVIAVVAIAAVGLIFTVFILPGIKSSVALNNACQSSNGGETYTDETDDYSISCSNGTCTMTKDGKTSSKSCN